MTLANCAQSFKVINTTVIMIKVNDINSFVGNYTVLGTPDEENWPGVSALPDFHKISFTKTRKQISFKKILIDVDESSRTMLEQFLRYCPQSRITAKQVISNCLT